MNPNDILASIVFGGDGGGGKQITKVEELSTDGGASDAGKVLVVGDNGKIAASDLTVGEGEIAVDKGLAVNGAAADAKAVGDAIASLNGSLETISENAIPANVKRAFLSMLDSAVFEADVSNFRNEVHEWAYLFPILSITERAYYDADGNVVTESPKSKRLNYLSYDYIPVVGGETYKWVRTESTSIGRVCFYDKSYNFISRSLVAEESTSVQFATPENARYIRLSWGSASTTTGIENKGNCGFFVRQSKASLLALSIALSYPDDSDISDISDLSDKCTITRDGVVEDLSGYFELGVFSFTQGRTAAKRSSSAANNRIMVNQPIEVKHGDTITLDANVKYGITLMDAVTGTVITHSDAWITTTEQTSITL